MTTPTSASARSRRRRRFAVGDRVRVERDETAYSSRGTWPRFRGRVGTVVVVNRDPRPHLIEYGVVWGKPRVDEVGGSRENPTWFLPHELVPASQPKQGGTPHERDDH